MGCSYHGSVSAPKTKIRFYLPLYGVGFPAGEGEGELRMNVIRCSSSRWKPG